MSKEKSGVPSKARQPNPQEVSDVRTRFNKDLEQLRERVKEDSATVKQKLTWRTMLEEPPATGFKRLTADKAIDLEGGAAETNSLGMGASASRAADGLRAVWQQLAGDSTSPEMPSLARKVLTMLGDNQGTMRKDTNKWSPTRMWAALAVALLLCMCLFYSIHAASVDILDEDVQYAPSATAAAAADAQPATLVQMLAADLRATEPQGAPVGMGVTSSEEWPHTPAAEAANAETEATEAEEAGNSSKRRSRSSDTKKKDQSMSTAIEEEIAKLRDHIVKDLLAKKPKSSPSSRSKSSSSKDHKSSSKSSSSKSSSHSKDSKDSKHSSSKRHGRRLHAAVE